ncbi:MAG: T9SS type A sorting domain-containing protein, partial [Acidobacteriota bacterium]|nr:T9SS type A sorting domain-containing protein [Acidobacteriota bacterium]
GPDHDPDWDGSGWERSFPVHSDGLARYTWRNNFSSFAPGKLDFILYTGSVVTPGNGFVLNTADMSGSKLSALGLLSGDSQSASDHMPVVQDFLPDGILVAVDPGGPESRLSLRASPNPTAGTTLLSFTLPAPGRARLVLYDVAGRVRFSIADESLGAGIQAREFSPAGSLEPGVYFLRLLLEARGGAPQSATTKLVVTH